jgi:hypothetical protein
MNLPQAYAQTPALVLGGGRFRICDVTLDGKPACPQAVQQQGDFALQNNLPPGLITYEDPAPAWRVHGVQAWQNDPSFHTRRVAARYRRKGHCPIGAKAMAPTPIQRRACPGLAYP